MSLERTVPYHGVCTECNKEVKQWFPATSEFLHDTSVFMRCANCEHINTVSKNE